MVGKGSESDIYFLGKWGFQRKDYNSILHIPFKWYRQQ